jgi:hypothetical protein
MQISEAMKIDDKREVRFFNFEKQFHKSKRDLLKLKIIFQSTFVASGT